MQALMNASQGRKEERKKKGLEKTVFCRTACMWLMVGWTQTLKAEHEMQCDRNTAKSAQHLSHLRTALRTAEAEARPSSLLHYSPGRVQALLSSQPANSVCGP